MSHQPKRAVTRETIQVELSVDDLRHWRGVMAALEEYQEQRWRYQESHDRLMRHLVPFLRQLAHKLPPT
jgi:hypothetical protein